MAQDPYDEDEQGSGLLPPDGVPWPPLPVRAPAPPEQPEALPTTPRRPEDAAIDDWRSMATEAPAGYLGGVGAPVPVGDRVAPWAVAALICAAVGALPWLWSAPLLPILAIAFGLAGRRECTLDPTRRGKVLATVAVVMGGVTLMVVIALLIDGELSLGGF